MGYLIAELSTIFLFFGFLALSVYEHSRGTRLCSSMRARLDHRVEQGIFIFSHVDFSAHIREVIQNGFEKIIHDLARAALYATQFLEKQLSHIIYTLRERFVARRAAKRATSAESSPFVRTIVDFKQELRDGRSSRNDRQSSQ